MALTNGQAGPFQVCPGNAGGSSWVWQWRRRDGKLARILVLAWVQTARPSLLWWGQVSKAALQQVVLRKSLFSFLIHNLRKSKWAVEAGEVGSCVITMGHFLVTQAIQAEIPSKRSQASEALSTRRQVLGEGQRSSYSTQACAPLCVSAAP